MAIPRRITPADMAAAPPTPGRLSKLAFDTGEIELRFYAPQRVDNQVAHDRDELYFVVSGSGAYEHETERIPF